jgi:hypothetical protein
MKKTDSRILSSLQLIHTALRRVGNEASGDGDDVTADRIDTVTQQLDDVIVKTSDRVDVRRNVH